MAEEVVYNPFEADDLDELNNIHRTYKMDWNKKRISGMIDDAEAASQAIVKALMTRRFAYVIYDDDYGCDIANKIGNTSLTKDYMDSDIPAMIEDMLLADETVIGIGDVEYEMLSGDSVAIKFVAYTIYGTQDIKGVIAYE